MRRATFLRASAGAFTAIALPQLSRQARAADVVEYTLTAAPLAFSPAPGVKFSGAAFNGTIPGPVLRAVHGQRIRATFINNATDGSTIHWHGMILPNEMDGVETSRSRRCRGGTFV